jgi:hypothetical protein
MKIELVKEYNKQGQISYYVKVDGEIYPQSINIELLPTLKIFDVIKAQFTQAKIEVLLVEEI